MTRFYKQSRSYMMLVAAAVCLSACSSILYEESHVTPERMQVKEEKFSEKMPLSQVDEDYLNAIGQHYGRYGDGVVNVTVMYDAKSKTNTAMHANNAMASLVRDLGVAGLYDVQANIIPIRGLGEDAEVLITYQSYAALPPEDCYLMDGFEDSRIDVDEDYQMGCSVETIMARQIARPKDLRGQDIGDNADGRRAANAVERHRTGVPNAPIGGESASGN